MRIHLIGGKAQSRFFNPEPGDEVWTLNNCWFAWARHHATRHFNIHKHENLVRYGFDIKTTVAFLEAHPKIKFYSTDLWPELKDRGGCYVFPRDDIAEMGYRADYHCGSFDWMAAFAVDLLTGIDRPCVEPEIIVHGVSLLIEAGEPISARACLEYWLGVAEGCGIKVTVTPDCDLFAFYHLVKSNMVYGYDDTPVYEDRTRPADGEPPYKLADAAE
jgi:hypothetical protein